jgi:hypothetical protein
MPARHGPRPVSTCRSWPARLLGLQLVPIHALMLAYGLTGPVSDAGDVVVLPWAHCCRRPRKCRILPSLRRGCAGLFGWTNPSDRLRHAAVLWSTVPCGSGFHRDDASGIGFGDIRPAPPKHTAQRGARRVCVNSSTASRAIIRLEVLRDRDLKRIKKRVLQRTTRGRFHHRGRAGGARHPATRKDFGLSGTATACSYDASIANADPRAQSRRCATVRDRIETPTEDRR